jgi:hypothetical protein
MSENKTTCGAQTRRCQCGHHQRVWHERGPDGVARGACTHEGCSCQSFKGEPCPHSGNLLYPNGRCRFHGGLSLGGVAHPNYQGKARSRYLAGRMPARMVADFHAFAEDPSRLSLQAEASLVRAMLKDVWERLADNALVARALIQAVGAVVNAKKAVTRARRNARVDPATHQMDEASSRRLAEAMNAQDVALDRLAAAAEPAVAEAAARDEVLRITDRVEKLVRSENQRVVELHGMVSLDAVLTRERQLMTVLMDAITKHERDQEILRLIRRDAHSGYARLAGRRDPTDVAAGGSYLGDPQRPASNH